MPLGSKINAQEATRKLDNYVFCCWQKFFVRCLKQDHGEKFVCARDKACVITKETRTQCPACRFHKCVSLGMYKPGAWFA